MTGLQKIKEQCTRYSDVVIFGCSDIGIQAKRVFDFMGVKIACYIDNDVRKQGKEIDGLKVISVEEAKSKYLEAGIFICSFKEENVTNIDRQLRDNGFKNVFGCKEIMNVYINNDLKYKNIYYEGSKMLINYAQILVTEKCTLRCRECGALIPYFKKPIHYSLENIIKTIEILNEIFDKIGSIGFIGGETLLYPYLGEAIQKAYSVLSSKGLTKINITTNGTILPTDELIKIMKECKVHITISDYRELSRKKAELIQLCKDNNISYDIDNCDWYDVGNLENREYEKKKVDYIFGTCRIAWMYNCILNGEYHLCCRSAYGKRLGAIPVEEKDYVDLLSESDGVQAIRKKLTNLLSKKDAITACNYCNGNYCTRVDRAIQVK